MTDAQGPTRSPRNAHFFTQDADGFFITENLIGSAIENMEAVWSVVPGAAYDVKRKRRTGPFRVLIDPWLLCQCTNHTSSYDICEHMIIALSAAESPLIREGHRKVVTKRFPVTHAQDADEIERLHRLMRNSVHLVGASWNHGDPVSSAKALLHPEAGIRDWKAFARKFPNSGIIRSMLSLIPEAIEEPDLATDLLLNGFAGYTAERIAGTMSLEVFLHGFRGMALRDTLAASALVSGPARPLWRRLVDHLAPNDLLPLLRSTDDNIREAAREHLGHLARSRSAPPDSARRTPKTDDTDNIL